MKPHCFSRLAAVALLGMLLAGCAAPPKPDYTNFRQHRPRSILVLPPLNESTAVEATYSYLSTVTMPLAEMGYYVFPVAVVDQFLKENGMPTAGEMHQIPLNKCVEILGADAVLFATLTQYGTKYQVINSSTIVAVKAKLVDARTGLLLWEGTGGAQQNSGGSGNLIADAIAAAVTQTVNSSTDAAHDLSTAANFNLLTLKNRGILYGPYHPQYLQEEAGAK
jgi:hypothetical protein